MLDDCVQSTLVRCARHCVVVASVSIAAFSFAANALAWQTPPAPITPPESAAPAPLVDSNATDEEAEEGFNLQPVPTAKTKPAAPIENRLPSFKGVTPSRTTLEQAKEALGEPVDQAVLGGGALLVFRVPPFQKVEVVSNANVVTSVVIHLEAPTSIEELAKELAIGDIQPAPIPDETGESLGKVYPERGITFAYSDADVTKAMQIVLEPITAEPFVLRAQYKYRQQFTRRITDLKSALKLDPKNAHVHWLLSKAYMAARDFNAARQHSTEAVRLDEQSAAYKLTKAEVQGKLGRISAGLALVRELLADESLTAEDRAKGECLLGTFLSRDDPPDCKAALAHHQLAIRYATSLASEPDAELRRSAKQILFDAHLGVAEDIAYGVWRRKEEVVPMWVGHAQQLAKDMVENESPELDFRLHVRTQFLVLADAIGMTADPTNLIETAISDAQENLSATDDPLTHQRINQDLSIALYHAASLEHRRNKSQDALAYAQQGVTYHQQARTAHDENGQQYHLGRLQFLIGAVYAIQNKDHKTAVKWYIKANETLANVEAPQRDLHKHGDRFVAMGVSFWHSGSKREALKITEQGTRLIQNAVQNGVVPPSALAVPYSNLAGMHRELGNRRDADKFAETAERLRPSKSDANR